MNRIWVRVPNGRPQGGFAFIEVIVVLVLLSVLAVWVTVGIRNTHAGVVAEADILRAHLRFVQTMAMANNTTVWGITITDTGYTMQRNGGVSPINLPGENAPARNLSGGVRVVGGTGMHSFCAWGCPGSTLQITLSDGTRQEHITVLDFTGLIQ